MKRLLLPLCLLFGGFVFSQNITWQNVTLNVPNENAQAVFNLIDGFYSNVEIPEGVRVSLWNIQFKGPSEKATHVLNLAGPTDALVEFESRKLTPEWDAYIAQLNSLTDPNGFSVTAGTTLVRYNLDKWHQPIAQSWQFKIKDPYAFISAFANLMSVFGEKSGYVSIGKTTHGNENGESHYIYATYPDLNRALDFGQIENEEEQNAASEWGYAVDKFAESTRTITRVMMQSWE